MDKQIITKLQKTFEDYTNKEDNVEFWFARDLQILLGYVEWRKFQSVIKKAKEACINSGYTIQDHFVQAAKKVKIGSETERKIEDMVLTRYACYLITQNGDPRKEEIAFAQSYFALQTRKQELIEQRVALIERLNARQKLVASETELSQLIYERGVDDDGFARIRSKGDQALFGGFTTAQMKNKLKIPFNRPIADFLPTVTITAKNLATEITNFNVKKENINNENNITFEHVKNNKRVRGILVESGITPENLPPEEDIKQLEQRVKKDERQMAEISKKKRFK